MTKFILRKGHTYTLFTDAGGEVKYTVTHDLGTRMFVTCVGDVAIEGRITDHEAFYSHDDGSTCGYLCAPNAFMTKGSVVIEHVRDEGAAS